MRFSFLFFIFPFINIQSFYPIKQNNFLYKTKIILYTKKNKFLEFQKLTRINNVLPTYFLTFSGAYISNPSLYNVIQSPVYLTTSFVTILILSLSMVLNDLYDIEVDKLNNFNRPLVTGTITKGEAALFSFFLFTLTEILSICFLPFSLLVFSNLSLLGVIIYTPILKKIPIVKNIFCASLVSFSLYFNGLSVFPISPFHQQMLFTIIRYIFIGSLSTELLCDCLDIQGDKENKITTIPVSIGVKNTITLIDTLLLMNIFNLLYNVFYFQNIMFVFPIAFLLPFYDDLQKIKKYDYNKLFLKKTISSTTIPMGFLLLSYCYLSYFYS